MKCLCIIKPSISFTISPGFFCLFLSVECMLLIIIDESLLSRINEPHDFKPVFSSCRNISHTCSG